MRQIQKQNDIIFKTPLNLPSYPIKTFEELFSCQEKITKETFDGIYQNLYEFYLWETVSEEDRKILCPILDFNKEECKIVVPFIEPIMDELKSRMIGEEDSTFWLIKEVVKRGGKKSQVKSFIKKVKELCSRVDLVENDILHNLSNLGYNEKYGLRVIDYGFSERLMFYELQTVFSKFS